MNMADNFHGVLADGIRRFLAHHRAVKRRAKLTRHRRPILTRLVPSFLPGSLFPVARSAGGVFGRRKDGWKARLRFSAAG